MVSPTPQSVRRLLAVRTAVAFAIVAALAAAGQGIVQHRLARLETGAHVVNLAGRQRMLSQQATKAALAAVVRADRPTAALAEMDAAVALLRETARSLRLGDAAAGLPPASPAPARALQALDADVAAIGVAARGVRASLTGSATGPRRAAAARPALGRLMAAERRFLPAMDRTVRLFDADARRRVQSLRATAFGLFGLVLAALGLVYAVLLRPAARQAGWALRTLEGRNAALAAANESVDDVRAAAVGAESARADFLACMSHEIRTPLTGVVGMAELLGDTDLDEAQQECVRTIRLSADALMALLNDLLDLSKAEAGQIDLEEEPFSLSVLVADALTLVAPGAARTGVERTAHVDASVPALVVGDPARVRQILLNLLSNAIKFTDAGEIEVTASAVPSKAGVEVRLAVRDTGVGVSADRLDALFDPFVQAAASTARTHGGTGLGLSISRRLAERMGGTLTATSQAGVGSTFTFAATFAVVPAALPADGPDEADAPPAGRDALVADDTETHRHVSALAESTEREPADEDDPEPQPALRPEEPPAEDEASPEPAAVPPRLLIAEDDPTNQRVALRMLERLGLTADLVADGEEAVAAVAGDGPPYAVVLMDIEMPRMGGVEALRALRAILPPHRQPRVLALTGHVDAGARARLAAAGFDGYLPKPLDLDALARALATAMPAYSHAFADADAPRSAEDAFVACVRPTADAEALRARLRAHVADLIGEDDPAFVADLSATFTSTAAALLADARTADARGDALALGAVAHQIRGSAANVGLADLAESWSRVERAADASEASDRLAAAAAETEHAVAALAEA